MSAPFVHLHLHSEYSLIDGIVRVPELVRRCRELEMPAVALTDYNNVFALPKFYRAALAAGIKPIVGAELNIAADHMNGDSYRVVALCQNREGYKRLSDLLTRAYRFGQRAGVPTVEEGWLSPCALEGMIVLSGGLDGDIGQLVLQGKSGELEQRARFWCQLLDDRFYIELTRVGKPREAAYNDAALALASRLSVPVVATNDVRFVDADDFEAHEARVCVNQGRTLSDPRRPRDYSELQYLRSAEDMQDAFKDLDAALLNSVAIAERCNLDLEFGTYHLPEYPVGDGVGVDQLLCEKAELGMRQRRHDGLIKVDLDDPQVRQSYQSRLDDELAVIKKMGFSGYFLIVADFIDWAKQHEIPVGPGRGSGAGSLVAFVIGITELDPIEYDLLFERFLNPERVSMPDFDVDFCMDRRDEVIEYVASRYGRDRVAQIITHGTMAAKAVLRDVGRVLGVPYGFVDQLAKLVPFDPQMTLTRALDEEPNLKARYEGEEDVKAIIDLALQLEGLARNAGRHAGGVVIAPSALTEYMPLYCEQGSDSAVTQFDMGDVESIGLVKFDFLGLRTLTIIDWAVRDINLSNAATDKEPVNILNIALDDSETFELVQKAQTTAVFQLESRGMKELIKRLKPDSFEDLIALVALFRPGPLQSGMVDDFIDRKHGKAVVKYPHPAVEPILRPTYGVILYQEQVMQIAQVLGGYTLGAADLLRRAMGKKKAEEMAQQREIFVSGAGGNDVAEKDATHIFDLMEKFAGYGFNKSHSAAYALVAYQTAWLKTHHTAAFMAAVLSADMDSTEKVVRLIEECRNIGINIQPPDVNACAFRFSVADGATVHYGLGAVKGVGEAVITAIVREREESGAYVSLIDLCRRNGESRLNRRALEALIKAGALDCFGQSRPHLMAGLDEALQTTEQHMRATASGQSDFFGLDAADSQGAPEQLTQFDNVPAWSDDERLRYEKDTLGLYLTGHPIDKYRDEIAGFASCTLAELKTGKRRVAGLIMAMRVIKTRRGQIAIASIDDKTARVEVTFFRDLFEQNMERLVVDQMIVIEGGCDVDDFSGEYNVQAERVLLLDEARNAFAGAVVLDVDIESLGNGFVDHLKDMIATHPRGDCPVAIEYQTDVSRARLRLGDDWRVQVNDKLLSGLREYVGDERVYVEYAR